MTEPRLPALSAPQGESLALELGLPARTGALLAFRVIANHPGLAKGIFTQHMAVRHQGSLPERQRELLIMRVAWRAGSAYEWSQHWRIATNAGVPPEQLERVRQWQDTDCFSATDRAVLQAVDDVFDHGEVMPESWERCSSALGSPLLALETVVAIVHWHGLAVLFSSLSIPLEPGETPWPPDGRSPAGRRQGTRQA
ncbi:MAG TPA: carboxymuconolactone decarboxylase family protein [Ramlibacter sp.]|nr:carboxymuconolactone decarboxylase family protein [Ramlibacter sp.]